jgi:amidase
LGLSVEEYQRCDATALAQLISRGDIDTGELLDTCIALIERHNPELNGVIHKLYDFAQLHLKNLPVSAPFSGVPLLHPFVSE